MTMSPRQALSQAKKRWPHLAKLLTVDCLDNGRVPSILVRNTWSSLNSRTVIGCGKTWEDALENAGTGIEARGLK